LLIDTTNPQSVSQFLNMNLQERLLALLATAAAAPASQSGLELINRSLEALFECCSRSHDFWAAFQKQPAAARVIQDLFMDERPFVRKNVAKLIKDRCVFSHGGDLGVTALHFAEMLWPVVFEVLPQATIEPAKCEEVLNLCFVLMKRLAEADSPILDIQACLAECERLILSHTSTEDVSHPEQVDLISHGLVSILHHGIKYGTGNQAMPLSASFPRRLFNRHLFPLEDADGPLVPRAILNPSTRSMLNDLIYILCKDNEEQYLDLLRLFSGLTTYKLINDSSTIPYKYDLPQSFERSKSVRSPCGYPGLRNLSNTCYLNSLFTQLFMNTHFRKFIMQVPVPNTNTHQLLAETQTLFSELQDSIRRFVDPLGCVNQIMNYDETPIDIHTQMDVDEFYNLLFDRWESQMPNTRAKKALRSIYGGQLVQQVKSKECEHISERIEPFSAIQCDIKGIASLEESLQAYVDGEIMEGDNKYKCETCDRHVDAVKRACLKDIPDHVIFHLKRFEFNLRTLQRSKINDHFAFPTKIDMQPYTVEHLSNPDKEAEPDEFELVGVLVHSGTAESGHYYSYIRERPSVGVRDSWVEFNDDSVSAWDPAHLEGSCFGGKDQSQRFDGSLGFEKVYSAYMLFYQRSSSLRKDQDLLKESVNRGPVRVDLKPELEEAIKEDNWSIVHRYCTNDASHIPFVKRVLSQRWDTYCTLDHKLENLAMRIALDHLDQVASRTKDLPDFQPLIAAVIQACQKCPRCGVYLFQYFSERPEALRMLLQRNSDPSVRQQTANLFLFVLGTIKLHYPQEFDNLEDEVYCREHDVEVEERSMPCTITRLVELFGTLFESFHTSIRAWPEFFGTIWEFASMGKSEVAALLDTDLLLKLLMIISADPTDQDLPPKYARMATAISRRQRPPNYEHILALIDIMLERLTPKLLTHQASVESPSGRLQLALDGLPIPFTAEEYNEIQRDWPKGQGSIFVDKLIQVDQNATATESILKRLMESGTKMDQKIYTTLRVGITDSQPNLPPVGPYLRAAVWYIQHSANASNVQQLILYACSQCRSLTSMEGMSYLVFFQSIFDSARRTEGDETKVRIKSLRDLNKWVPGLLGYMDRSVSYKLEFFLDEILWQVEPVPGALGEESGAELTREMILAAKKLGIGCLVYLQDTYVAHVAQVPRESVIVFERVIKRCREFFVEDHAAIGADLDRQFNELMPGKRPSNHIPCPQTVSK
jgi:ubiquitin carboxyl-terminal hydrolase 34